MSSSIVETVKAKVGLVGESVEYHCADCGETFERREDADAPWFSCPACDSRDVERAG
jgi:DNA-directed RNA polymerase subunit RPC12/RpoP